MPLDQKRNYPNPKVPKRIASKEDLFEAYAWFIATEERANESYVWLKYSPEQVLAAYRRADETRREITSNIAKAASA